MKIISGKITHPLRITLQLVIISLIISLPTLTCKAQREAKTINDEWKFFRGDIAHASEKSFDDTNWSEISIPHTWNTDAYIDKNYYKGIGWYRRKLQLPQTWINKQIFLKFEAASKAARVYINGTLAGEHLGGYTAFTIDITPYCSFTSENTIAVCVDNSRTDIPPVSADFTFFGGIYRDAWIIALPKEHFDMSNRGSDGIFIQTPKVSEKEASLTVRGTIENDANQNRKLEIKHTIYSPDGNLLQTLEQSIEVKANGKADFSKATVIKTPQLWSPEQPSLYLVKTTLIDKQSKKVLDEISNNTGFRWFSFDQDKGFFLNGKSYKLHGICRHQDQKPIGVALSDEMHRRDMEMIKDMGANFIRISHYPQDNAILEQCDKLGILAWEEIPVIDYVPDTVQYGNVAETNLREMIRQHYNHPSIIMWGYMNEILLVTQRKYKQKEQLDGAVERIKALANRLEKALKEEDPGRKSVMALHASNMYNETGISDITDVIGWNIYSGWYGNDLSGFEKYLEDQHQRYPQHCIIVSEYGAGSDKRLHSLQPKRFDFSIEYQQQYAEHYLPVIEEKPYVCGGTYWNFIDFCSALRDESMPRINNKGLVYSDREPKDVFYYFKSFFRKDIPVLHISKDWINRAGIQSNNEPVVQPVKIYTNLPEVELFMDGKSIGRKKAENCTVLFDVPFTNGTHFLHVIGSSNNQTIEDGTNIKFTSIPETLTDKTLKNLELAINVGSNCFYTSDESNLNWVPDRAYVKGSWGYVDGEDKSKETNTQTQIQNTPDNPLYQTLRSNLNGYRFDVPSGTYEVELLFSDVFKTENKTPYQLSKTTTKATGANCFNIYINSNKVEDSFSPGETAGYFEAVKKRYVVNVGLEGSLEVKFEKINGNIFLNGIKLRKIN